MTFRAAVRLVAVKEKKCALADLLGIRTRGTMVCTRFHKVSLMDSPFHFFFGLETGLPIVSADANKQLEADISSQELLEALQSLDTGKAPGSLPKSNSVFKVSAYADDIIVAIKKQDDLVSLVNSVQFFFLLR